jgi:hypothetical protein
MKRTYYQSNKTTNKNLLFRGVSRGSRVKAGKMPVNYAKMEFFRMESKKMAIQLALTGKVSEQTQDGFDKVMGIGSTEQFVAYLNKRAGNLRN